MSIARYSSGKVVSLRERVVQHQAMHIAMSRRQFLQTTTGATALAALGGGLVAPGTAAAQGVGNALPIPTTLSPFGVDIHVQAPPFTGVDTDPATVWNFQGAAGIALINTTATRTNRKTGEVRENLPSTLNHMTFMKGVYRGRDGHVRNGTFSLV
jgi:TAT (twin-arginine translocation) pathway signal sequence